MNYSKHYELLIQRAKNRILESYTESHHIIPRCMGGFDDKTNLVNLTPEEHYLAHQLLVKIYPNHSGLVRAANMMSSGRPNNKLYGWLRKKMSIAMSEIQSGTGNSQHGTKWVHNKAMQISKRIRCDAPLDDGWCLGRVLNWNKTPDNKMSKAEMYQKRRDDAKKLAQKLFDLFINSEYTSICEFARANNTTQPRLSALWKKHVKEYNDSRAHGKSFKN